MIYQDILLDKLQENGYGLFHFFDIDCLKDKYGVYRLDRPDVIQRFEIPYYAERDSIVHIGALLDALQEAIPALEKYLKGES